MSRRWCAVSLLLVACASCAADGPDDLTGASPGSVATAVSSDAPTTTTASPTTTSTVVANATSTTPRTGTPEAFIVLPRSRVVVQRGSDGLSFEAIFGYIGVRNQSIDFLARRPAYSQPIEVELERHLANRTEKVTLDPILQPGWEGIAAAGTVTIRDAADEVIAATPFSWCPASSPQRIDPAGSSADPLIGGCGAPALALGARWQLPDGWASQVLLSDGIDLALGDYTATVEIAAPLATALKMRDRSATLQVHVEQADLAALGDIFADDPTFTGDTFTTDAVTGDIFTGDGGFDPFGGDPLPPPPEPVTGDDAGPEHDTKPVDPAALPSDASLLPDLRALPAWGISVYLASDGREYLSYSATVWNAGPGPMVIEGFREEDAETMTASQMFRDGSRDVASIDIGTLEYHGGEHNHWHFLDFARYELTDADKTVINRSAKQSWCLAATDAIDLSLPTADLTQGAQSLTSQCGGADNVWIREALPAGWGDTYSDGFVEQHFDVTDLANGTYYIKITANPYGNIAEGGDVADNTAYRRIELSGDPGPRSVRVPPYQGIDTEADPFAGFGFGFG